MKKLTICYLDFDDVRNPLLGAGQAWATAQVGKELSKMGHRVISLCSRYPGYKDRIENGVEYYHIGLGTRFIKLNNLFYFLAVPWEVRKVKADIVIECFTAPFSTLFSPLFTKNPVVVLPSMFNAKEFARKYHLPFHWVEKFGLRFYKYMMPYSQVDQSKARLLNPKIITRIIPQGVDRRYFEIKRKKSEHILFLSRLDIQQKGIDLLLEAYAQIKERIKYPLVIARHGPDEGKVKDLIKKLKLTDKVQVVGAAYGDKKYELMSKAIFVAFPSRHDEMCLWTLEALASGLPIVCFDLPESSWMNNQVALKARCFDTKQYAALMLKAIRPDINRRMSQAAKAFASQFSWKKVAKQILDFCYWILEEEKKKGMGRQYFTSGRFLLSQLKDLLRSLSPFKSPNTNGVIKFSGYNLEKIIVRRNSKHFHNVGIYLNEKKQRVIIKSIPKGVNAQGFYQLLNEISFYNLFTSLRISQNNVRLPKLIEVIDEPQRLGLVLEYIQGGNLAQTSSHQIREVLIQVLKFLQQLSSMLPPAAFNALPRRSPFIYLLSFPVYLLLIIKKDPRGWRDYVLATFHFFRLIILKDFWRPKYHLAHKDLNVDNILLKDKQIILLDPQIMVWAHHLTDLAIVNRYYFTHLTRSDQQALLSMFIEKESELKLFFLLTLYFTIQVMANRPRSSEDFINARRYLKHLVRHMDYGLIAQSLDTSKIGVRGTL